MLFWIPSSADMDNSFDLNEFLEMWTLLSVLLAVVDKSVVVVIAPHLPS